MKYQRCFIFIDRNIYFLVSSLSNTCYDFGLLALMVIIVISLAKSNLFSLTIWFLVCMQLRQWRIQKGDRGSTPPTVLKYGPRDLCKKVIKCSKRAFPSIGKSLTGVGPEIFLGAAPKPPLLKAWIRL